MKSRGNWKIVFPDSGRKAPIFRGTKTTIRVSPFRGMTGDCTLTHCAPPELALVGDFLYLQVEHDIMKVLSYNLRFCFN